jgi:hypothetical protein
MHTVPGQPRRTTRLARIFGLDGNPLRRASHRAEIWIRVGLLAVFLLAGPLVALGAGHWAYHAGSTGFWAPAAQTHLAALHPGRSDGGGKPWVWAGADAGGPAPAGVSPRTNEMVAAVMALAFTALALLAVLRLTLVFLRWRRLAAWETAWSKVEPQWSRGRP